MSRIRTFFRREAQLMRLLLRAIPAPVVTLFVVSVICMNLLANKTLLQLDWIALDGGMLISWLSFMCMDVITRRFGAGASNRITLLAAAINLLTCLIFSVASAIPSNAGDFSAFDRIFGGTWFILLSSTAAFLLSGAVNNLLHMLISRRFRRNPHGKAAFAASTYLSTFAGQFLDNFLFSVLVFMCFAPVYWNGFHWTLMQCFMCALTGACAELLLEAAFSPIGWRITNTWRREQVGQAYLDALQKGIEA